MGALLHTAWAYEVGYRPPAIVQPAGRPSPFARLRENPEVIAFKPGITAKAETPPAPPQDVLVSRSADESALCKSYLKELQGYFRRRGCSGDTARDLTQETLTRVIGYSRRNQVNCWKALTYRVAANLLLDHARSGRRPEISFDPAGDDAPIGLDDTLIETLTPERRLDAKATLAVVMTAIKAMDRRTRSVFIRHRIDGLKQQDIARDMGISLSLVERSMACASAQLREALARGSSAHSRVRNRGKSVHAEEAIDQLAAFAAMRA